MERDFESWLHQPRPGLQFPNANSLKLPFELGMQNASIPYAAPISGALPSFGYTGPLNFKAGQSKEPQKWFYCLPRFRQGLVPDAKLVPENDFLPGKAHAAAIEYHGEANVCPNDAQCAPKQFLVFDRTGNKTTLILSSMIGASNQPLDSWNKRSSCYYNVNEGELGNGSNGQFHSGPNLTDDLDDDNDMSEMHEDTEDIDALLSSDDEDNYSEDGEEASTGRSPSTTSAYEKQDWFDQNDEVASSAGPSKRPKLSDSSYEVPSVTYSTSSLKPKGGSLEYEDDAQSSCAGGGQPTRPYDEDVCSLSGTKRERKEKIRETVSILQTILPSGDGKDDAVVVLDEAINYLKTLKYKAKCLGISGL